MAEAVLAVDGVAKRFGRRIVLDRLELGIARGEITVLLGRNGAGKSTLLRIALGLVRADAGIVRVAGVDPWRDPDRVRRLVGYVPDVPDACRWMRVGELVEFARAHDPALEPARAMQLGEQLGVPRATPLGRMSRGEAMKTMLLLAAAAPRELLLLDEPFGGLDPVVRQELLGSVLGIDGGPAVLVATHELDLVARLADRVLVLADGRIVRDERIDEAARGATAERCLAALAQQEVGTC
jgi:ABC-2 type transport system ATP-binding protein